MVAEILMVEKLRCKTLKCDAHANADAGVSDNTSSLYYRTGELTRPVTGTGQLA